MSFFPVLHTDAAIIFSSVLVKKEIEQTIKNSYYRFQTFLPNELKTIDNTKPVNIRQLKALAHELISRKNQEIDEVCSLLTS
ncbi:MAG: hypothetical protein AAF316_09825 [Cyanobacteria bacterium P01_A01_bin.80]